MAKKSKVEEKQVPTQPETPEAAATEEVQPETAVIVPTFTLRADTKFGRAVMFAARHYSHLLPHAEIRELAQVEREFELYEETTRS